MKYFTIFCLLLLINIGFSFTGASAAYKHQDRELTTLERDIFDLLKKKFPEELIDAKLKTLNAIAASPEYLDNFLPKVHPNFAPFLDFHDFDDRVMPPKDRYLEFCQEYLGIPSIEEISDDEQYVIHHIATSSWATEASARGKDSPPSLQKGKPYRLGHVLAFKPMGKAILEHRTDAKRAPFAFILLTTREHLDEDVRWIKDIFEKYGKSDGMLRIALQDPMLFYRILYAFSTDATFLKCLYDPVDVEAEQKERLDKKYGKRSQPKTKEH